MAEDRKSFTIRRKKWYKKRDGNKCQAPFRHKCDLEHPLQVHHILPHAYLNTVAPDVTADFPENGITLCRCAHEMIHPDTVWARKSFHSDNTVFEKLRAQRTLLMSQRKIYWVDCWDRMMQVIALKNTQKYLKKHPFPEYTERKKHEKIKEYPYFEG